MTITPQKMYMLENKQHAAYVFSSFASPTAPRIRLAPACTQGQGLHVIREKKFFFFVRIVHPSTHLIQNSFWRQEVSRNVCLLEEQTELACRPSFDSQPVLITVARILMSPSCDSAGCSSRDDVDQVPCLLDLTFQWRVGRQTMSWSTTGPLEISVKCSKEINMATCWVITSKGQGGLSGRCCFI